HRAQTIERSVDRWNVGECHFETTERRGYFASTSGGRSRQNDHGPGSDGKFLHSIETFQIGTPWFTSEVSRSIKWNVYEPTALVIVIDAAAAAFVWGGRRDDLSRATRSRHESTRAHRGQLETGRSEVGEAALPRLPLGPLLGSESVDGERR